VRANLFAPPPFVNDLTARASQKNIGRLEDIMVAHISQATHNCKYNFHMGQSNDLRVIVSPGGIGLICQYDGVGAAKPTSVTVKMEDRVPPFGNDL
jgi:hypothetical protein